MFLVSSLRSCCVGDTLACAVEGREEPLPTPGVAPPTLAMVFGVNTGPLQGREGTYVTGQGVVVVVGVGVGVGVSVVCGGVASMVVVLLVLLVRQCGSGIGGGSIL